MQGDGVAATYLTHVVCDGDAGVYVATSEDVPGLVVEAETRQQLQAEIGTLIPKLISFQPGGQWRRPVRIEFV